MTGIMNIRGQSKHYGRRRTDSTLTPGTQLQEIVALMHEYRQ